MEILQLPEEVSPVLFANFGIQLFLAILFLQSGLDKVNNFKGNLDWLNGHFSKSPLKGQVKLMLRLLTVLEMVCGVLAVSSMVFIIMSISGTPYNTIPFVSLAVSLLTLASLFFGQRMAQDYEGASGIVPYFIVVIAGLFLLSL